MTERHMILRGTHFIKEIKSISRIICGILTPISIKNTTFREIKNNAETPYTKGGQRYFDLTTSQRRVYTTISLLH